MRLKIIFFHGLIDGPRIWRHGMLCVGWSSTCADSILFCPQWFKVCSRLISSFLKTVSAGYFPFYVSGGIN